MAIVLYNAITIST